MSALADEPAIRRFDRTRSLLRWTLTYMLLLPFVAVILAVVIDMSEMAAR